MAGIDTAKEVSEKYGYSLPLAVVGTALLWLGWFGFNPGSSLDLTRQSAMAAIATNTAAAAAGMVALLMAKWLDGKWDPVAAISGILGGLVMITPNAGYVDALGSVILGVLAGVVTIIAIKAMDKYLYHIDDPVGGFPVHGVNGIVGTAIVPLFANPAVSGIPQAGFFYGGGGSALTWFFLQVVGVVVVTVVSFAASWFFVKIAESFMAVRATVSEEVQGLDLADHGVEACGPTCASHPLDDVKHRHFSQSMHFALTVTRQWVGNDAVLPRRNHRRLHNHPSSWPGRDGRRLRGPVRRRYTGCPENPPPPAPRGPRDARPV
ncbi:MAG: ammonium transporter [Chloroflexi bacterium]|nr:ammonium transporter [Chloroflexota bacterium]